MKAFRPFSFVFALVFIIQLYGEYTANKMLIQLSKPLITITLMGGLYVATKLAGKFKKRIFYGLLFALAGDVFLMFQQDSSNFFIFGLVCFLICHILYFNAFQLDFRAGSFNKIYFLVVGSVLAAFCGSFYMYLRPGLGGMAVPVLLYSIIITIMVMFALYRYKNVNMPSFVMIAVGALLFFLSDASLAYNKFKMPLPNAGILIMGTYMLAQYLITAGAVMRVLPKPSQVI